MHSLEMLVRLNSARYSRKLRRAARKLNNPKGHAKDGEKGFAIANSPAAWTMDAEWEAKMAREGKR